MAASTARSETAVPSPPRSTGDAQADLIAQIQWANDFYRTTVVQSGLLDPAFQANAGTFDADNLPDPTATSIARAQDTANHAYQLAATAEATRLELVTDFTLADANNTATVTFSTPLASADVYRVMAQATGFSGAPVVEAFTVIGSVRTAAGFTLTFGAAPGLGNTVSFQAFVFKN